MLARSSEDILQGEMSGKRVRRTYFIVYPGAESTGHTTTTDVGVRTEGRSKETLLTDGHSGHNLTHSTVEVQEHAELIFFVLRFLEYLGHPSNGNGGFSWCRGVRRVCDYNRIGW